MGLLLSGPVLAASPAPADNPALTTRMERSPGDPSPRSQAATRTAEPTLPREPNPTGIAVPDQGSAVQIKRGEYGVGLGLLIVGGVIFTAAVVGLFLLLMRRTWGDHHEAGAPSRH